MTYLHISLIKLMRKQSYIMLGVAALLSMATKLKLMPLTQVITELSNCQTWS